MDGSVVKVFVAALGFGLAGELIRRYRAFKARRRLMPVAERNSGFWTDSRIYHAEAIGAALALCAPWTMIVLAVATNDNLYADFLAVLGYPIAIYLILVSLNVREAQ